MSVWLFSLPSRRNSDGDRCKRAETHTNDLSRHCVESLDYPRARRVGSELFGVGGNRRREVNTWAIAWIGKVKPQDSAVIAVDDVLTSERLRFFERVRRKVIPNRVENYITECCCGVKIAGLRRRGAICCNGSGLVQISRAEQNFMTCTRPAQSECAPHISRTDYSNFHNILAKILVKPFVLLDQARPFTGSFPVNYFASESGSMIPNTLPAGSPA